MLRIATVIIFMLVSLQMMARNQFVVGTSLSYPPYEYIDAKGELQGFNIEIINAIGKKKNSSFDFFSSDWDKIFKMLDEKKIDIISGIFFSGQRSEKFLFSVPYATITYTVFSRTSAPVEYFDELKDATIIVEKQDQIIEYIRSNFPQARIIEVANHKDAVFLLSNQNYNCAFLSEKTAGYIINHYQIKNLTSSANIRVYFNYCMAVSKENQELLKLLNSGIEELKKSGEFDRIYDKMILQKTSVNWPKLILWTNSILVIILLFFSIWNYYLQRKLKTRTIDLSHLLTERKKSENELRESQSRLRQIIDLVPHMIYAKDINGNYILANKAVADMYKTTPEFITGRNQKEFHDDFEEVNKMLSVDEEVIMTNKPRFIPHDTFTDKSGRKHILQTTKLPFKDSGLNIPVVLGISIDITEKYYADQTMIREKAIFSSIINSIPDLIYYKDTNGVYLGGNQVFRNFLGTKALDYVGKNDFEVFGAETGKKYFDVDQQVIKTRKVWTEKVWDTTSEGKHVYLENIKVPFVDAEGHILGLVGISHDITDRYNAEKALAIAKDKAEESDRLKSIFLANISHEIRTPMNAIIGFTDLLADHDLTLDQRDDFIQQIRTSGNSLLMLIDDIVDLTKLESGQLNLTVVECNVDNLFNELLIHYNEILRRYDRTEISLKFKKPGEEELVFMADSLRIKQVLINLINNAIKNVERGTIEFGYKLPEDNFVEFFVSDTGVGISSDKHESIFDRYGHVSDSFITSYGGSGLGLSLSKGLVELMGGKIWMSSEIGKGTVFCFSVPFTHTIIKREPQPQKTQVTAEPKKETIDWSKYLVLIAEDEETNYLFLYEVLKRTRVKLLWAHNGVEAVEIVKNTPEIDLVLMDLKMPGMNGYEATKLIRLMMPDMPVIAQTAYAMSDERERSIESGCNDYLTKPIKPSLLLSVIKKYLQ